MKKIFGGIEMTWKRVIIFSVIAGVYTGLINQVPFLYDTSLTDIAVNFERWILFALFIMLNCKSPLEAAKKTFVFFLISQPLVYITEVPFLGVDILHYYKNWIGWTILTIPMAYIGNLLLKKKNWFSLLVLLPVLLLFSYSYSGYFNEALFNYMHHIYSALFCIGIPFLIFYVVFDKKKFMIISSIVYLLMLIPFTIKVFTNRRVYDTTLRCSSETFYFDENYKIEITNKKMGEIKIKKIKFGPDDDAYCLNGIFKHTGKTEVILTDPEGTEARYDLVVKAHTFDLSEKK